MSSNLLIRHVLIAVGLILTVAGIGVVTVGTAAAQTENITVETGGELDEGEECTEQITQSLRICDAYYESGTATVVFESDGPERLTLTDSGGFISGGEVFRESATVYEGKNAVSIPATQVKGFAGVSIDTGSVLYAKKITEVRTTGPPIQYQTAQGAIGLTALGAGAFTFRVVRRRRDDESKEVERIL